MPVWNVLERSEWKFELTLVNPQHVHALPGRKTDQQDSERIAELLQYSLLRGSFIPPVEVRELRDLTRRRTHVQGERNRIINRIGRLLETANIKLGSVVSDLSGKTSSLILANRTRCYGPGTAGRTGTRDVEREEGRDICFVVRILQ